MMKKKIKTEEDIRADFSDVEAKLEKKYGKGVLMKLTPGSIQKIPAISTGSLTLDNAIGIGGIPRGRITEIFGDPSCGKTTLCLSIMKECQKAGGQVVFIDMENCFDIAWAEKVGVDTSKITFCQPNSANEALDILKVFIESGKADLIVLDSVASLACTAEIEGEVGDSHIGLLARLLSQTLKTINININKSKTAVLMTNQMRSKIQTFGFGSPNTTSGGRALGFYASVRLSMARIKTLKKGEIPIGVRIKAKVVKNKTSSPFKAAEFEIYFDTGICGISDVLQLAILNRVIIKKGAWISYKGNNIGQGMDGARQFLKDNNKIYIEIKNIILKMLGNVNEN